MTTATAQIIGVHPYADAMGPLVESEVNEIADSIAEVRQINPIIVTQDGVLVDGRNRQAACRKAGVEPIVQVRHFDDDDEIADFVIAANSTRRHRTTGQRAMATALVLAAAGRRQNGRWKRGSVDIGNSSNTEAETLRKAVAKAGHVIDVARRAETLGADFHVFVDLPTQVIAGGTDGYTLDAAHKISQQFEEKAAMAEMALWLPFTKSAGELEQLSLDAEAAELPAVDAPLTKSHRAQLEDTAKRFTATAAAIRTYLKENK